MISWSTYLRLLLLIVGQAQQKDPRWLSSLLPACDPGHWNDSSPAIPWNRRCWWHTSIPRKYNPMFPHAGSSSYLQLRWLKFGHWRQIQIHISRGTNTVLHWPQIQSSLMLCSPHISDGSCRIFRKTGQCWQRDSIPLEISGRWNLIQPLYCPDHL